MCKTHPEGHVGAGCQGNMGTEIGHVLKKIDLSSVFVISFNTYG